MMTKAARTVGTGRAKPFPGSLLFVSQRPLFPWDDSGVFPATGGSGSCWGTSAQRPHICGTHTAQLFNPGPHGHWLELEGRTISGVSPPAI